MRLTGSKNILVISKRTNAFKMTLLGNAQV